ncbi:exodeoxyribonuclease V subunit alpha [Spiribacter sp. 218]|jgi:exodeoxyribonuclease V alpha subunit|uniref:exodeoxyribonuclease V subunit alpha n=1 Tax=Spiribacter pallidus TaxID=1987936 RepID=UPI00349F89B1
MTEPRDILNVLQAWRDAGWIRSVDLALARFIHGQRAGVDEALLLAAALASHQLGRGHVCLDLPAALADPGSVLSLPPQDRAGTTAEADIPAPATVLGGLDLAGWQRALDDPAVVGDGPGSTPLVRVGHRLYLRRYWQYEQQVIDGLTDRLRDPATPSPAPLRPRIDALFADTAGAGGTDWQRIACALAARGRLAVITGGPGTGKTTTVLKLLVLLQATAHAQGEPAPRMGLAAPTGKAAARLDESIRGRLEALPLAEVSDDPGVIQAGIPSRVHTLHRLLGVTAGGGRPRYHPDRPLPLDVLVVDEASMVDLRMMAALLAALPASARLVLLGDRDQLASVEAGAVLGELCARAEAGHYNDATCQWLALATGEALPAEQLDPRGEPLDQAVVMLRDSHRFAGDSDVGRLARAINDGRADALDGVAGGEGGIDTRYPETPDTAALREPVVAGYRAYLEQAAAAPPTAAERDRWAGRVLAEHRRFQVLAAVRHGPWGVLGLNEQIEAWLMRAGLIPAGSVWYPGRPVMMTRNDYALGLMNGDVGVTLSVDGRPRVAFPPAAGGATVRWVSPLRLGSAETVYAMTVHKSQGSEFDAVALVLPPGDSPLLTRELLYTGVTRARQRVTLVLPGGRRGFDAAVRRRIRRATGLSAGLWRE